MAICQTLTCVEEIGNILMQAEIDSETCTQNTAHMTMRGEQRDEGKEPSGFKQETDFQKRRNMALGADDESKSRWRE